VGGKMQLIFYRNGKKLFCVDSDMSNFELLLERMKAEKRLERGFLTECGMELNEWKDEFAITETAADKFRAVFGLLLGTGMFVGGIFCWNELREETYWFFYYAVILLMFAAGIGEFTKAMFWKVTVTYREIHVRDAVGRVRTYALRDITRVEEKDAIIILYVNQKKIAKIDKASKNSALLVERINRAAQREGRTEGLRIG
jgi:Formate hydrogenlyase subunit 3/Multisubunit Na+/H+ antiporter, MnhD subunit